MDNFILKIKLDQARGMNLFRFFSVILTFYCVVFSGVKSDTSYISGGSYTERLHTPSAGITRANIDTSHSRHATADSATIPVFKGTKTFRDSAYFAGGLRGLRLYMQTASVDTFTKGFVVRGNVFGFSQTAGSCPFTSYGTTNKINGYFGTLSNNDGGVICYDSSGTARINLPTRGSGYILGSIAINQTTPDSNLTVGGSAHVTGNSRIDGGLRLGSGDLLSVYDTGSFACTVKVETNGFTSQRIGKMSYCVIGSSVTASFDTSLVGTISSGGTYLNIYATIPQTIIPSRNKVVGIPNVLNNNVGGNGLMTIKTDGMITVGVVGYFEGGLCGVAVSTGHSTSFSYNKN